MKVLRGVKAFVEEGVEKMFVNSWGIDEVSRNNPTEIRTEARLIHQVSKSYRGCKTIFDRSTKYREAIGIAIRKSWRSSTDNKVSKRRRASFSKSFFEKRKTLTLMQSNMQLNQWSNQHVKLSKSSLNKNFKHMDLQKETHTLNKSNQFYISKTSQDSLVSIH